MSVLPKVPEQRRNHLSSPAIAHRALSYPWRHPYIHTVMGNQTMSSFDLAPVFSAICLRISNFGQMRYFSADQRGGHTILCLCRDIILAYILVKFESIHLRIARMRLRQKIAKFLWHAPKSASQTSQVPQHASMRIKRNLRSQELTTSWAIYPIILQLKLSSIPAVATVDQLFEKYWPPQ